MDVVHREAITHRLILITTANSARTPSRDKNCPFLLPSLRPEKESTLTSFFSTDETKRNERQRKAESTTQLILSQLTQSVDRCHSIISIRPVGKDFSPVKYQWKTSGRFIFAAPTIVFSNSFRRSLQSKSVIAHRCCCFFKPFWTEQTEGARQISA